MSFSSGIQILCKVNNKNQDGENGMEKINGHVLKTEAQAGNSCLRCTLNRAVLEPIFADLNRLWKMRHWISDFGKQIICRT